jgi:hypothetical protein
MALAGRCRARRRSADDYSWREHDCTCGGDGHTHTRTQTHRSMPTHPSATNTLRTVCSAHITQQPDLVERFRQGPMCGIKPVLTQKRGVLLGFWLFLLHIARRGSRFAFGFQRDATHTSQFTFVKIIRR